MKKYIIRRLLLSLIVLMGVVLITFIITRVVPSDPAAKWAGARATPAQVAAARIELGLDKSYPIQFVKYVGDLAKGNLGYSLRTRNPVVNDLKVFIPATVELVMMATLLALMIGIPLGIYSAKYKNRPLDHLSRFFSIGAVSLPGFWMALALQLVFYSYLNVLPLGGRVSLETSLMGNMPNITGLLLLDSLLTGNLALFQDAFRHMILPMVTIALYPIGLVSRMTRSAMLEILGEDYITAERSYGLSERLILWVYALKNSLGPTATVVTLSIGYTLMSTFLVESIFNWPGIGKYVASSIVTLDYPAIMGVTIFSAICYMILNLIADLIISLDPRIRV
ncbi:MAG: ABC transporter permease [Eubacteriales bacterium]